eukprot:TRINITY_DN28460_c0_g1_i1.p1 TRINITY_DN28460_c0_g1~~TRINITY_DN28460_c0_g1_i1.p1  ORF type:complete len:118 (+),score=36.84 TRINITY_DN28460_c0_g1_i1:99-452(+)
MIRRPPRSTLSSSSAASDVYKRQLLRVWWYTFPHLLTLCLVFAALTFLPDWAEVAGLLVILLQRVVIAVLQVHADRGWWSRFKGMIWHLSLIHISEPTRLLSISYAVFCLKKKNKKN